MERSGGNRLLTSADQHTMAPRGASKLHGYHVSLACTTWSWACLSKKCYRTLEGAAIDNEAQVVEKVLTLTLKAAKDLHKVNGKALITFESPKHGSFKSNAQVQAMLRVEGFWLVELDYWPTRHWTVLFMLCSWTGGQSAGRGTAKKRVRLY